MVMVVWVSSITVFHIVVYLGRFWYCVETVYVYNDAESGRMVESESQLLSANLHSARHPLRNDSMQARCDSSGDLYPVTQPSLTPHALLSVSLTTWHQRLGHPGEEGHGYEDISVARHRKYLAE
ncbi:hypothetical protein Tco_1504578 [Tanacetum coccineum]